MFVPHPLLSSEAASFESSYPGGALKSIPLKSENKSESEELLSQFCELELLQSDWVSDPISEPLVVEEREERGERERWNHWWDDAEGQGHGWDCYEKPLGMPDASCKNVDVAYIV